MSNKNDTLYLNGIKGVACIIVFLMHFINTFYPAVFNGEIFSPHLPNNFDATLLQSPFLSLINGRIMVGVFMVISGMVLTIQVIKNTSESKLTEIVFKRYFRFTFVLFAFCLIVFFMSKAGLFFATECCEITDARGTKFFYTTEFSFLDVFEHTFYLIPFKKSTVFSLAFWCIKDMLIGSFVSILLGLSAKRAKKGILVLFVVLYIMFAYNNFWFSSFVLGSVLGYIYVNKENFYKEKYKLVYDILGVTIFVLGMIIGAYPWRMEPTNFYSTLGSFIPENIIKADFFEMFGAFLIVSGISMSRMRFLFSKKPMLFLGKISFSVFLLHVPVIYSIGCWSMVKLDSINVEYILSTVIVFILTVLITIISSCLFNRFIANFCNNLIQKFLCLFYYKN